MNKPLLHFAHANGIPAGCYRTLYGELSEDFEVIHIDRMGHNPKYPIVAGWETSALELIDFIEENADKPVIGAGHSFGASVTFLAAVQRPDLFKGLILIEPILVNGWRKYPVRIVEKMGYLPQFTPAKKSVNRRSKWQDMAAAEAYFRSKSLYNAFDEKCFQDFLQYGLTSAENGLELYFEVEKEVAIFSSIPHQMDQYRGQLAHMPGVVISGDKSDSTLDAVMKRLARQHSFDHKIIHGGHLFPLEQPSLAIKLLRQYGLMFR